MRDVRGVLPDAVAHTGPQPDPLLLRHPGGKAGHGDPPRLRDADHLPALSSIAGLVQVLGQLGGLSTASLSNNHNYLDNRSSSSSSVLTMQLTKLSAHLMILQQIEKIVSVGGYGKPGSLPVYILVLRRKKRNNQPGLALLH